MVVAVRAEVRLLAAVLRRAQVLPPAGVTVTFVTLVICCVVVAVVMSVHREAVMAGGVASGSHGPDRYLPSDCQACEREGKKGRAERPVPAD